MAEKRPRSDHAPAEVSSLIALLRGDEDELDRPVPHPALVALILDGLADPKSGGRFLGSAFTLAERLYPELVDASGPKTAQRYCEVIGVEAWNAIVTGLAQWKKQTPGDQAA